MRLFSAFAAAAVLLTAAPAFAQDAAGSLPAPAAVATARSNLEAAGRAIEPVFVELKAAGDVVRADTTLTPEQKLTRIGELIAARQPEIDRFIAALQALVYAEAQADGASPADATAAAEMYRGLVNQTLLQSMVTGQSPE